MSNYLSTLFTDPAALIGLLVSLIVIVSMCSNTRAEKGELWMRLPNFIGSIISVIYGVILGPAGFGTVLLVSKHRVSMKTGKHITDNLLRQRGFDQLFGTSYGKGTSNEQLMLDNGFVVVYDAGQATYVWTN